MVTIVREGSHRHFGERCNTMQTNWAQNAWLRDTQPQDLAPVQSSLAK